MTEITVEALTKTVQALEARVEALESATTPAALAEAVSKQLRRLTP